MATFNVSEEEQQRVLAEVGIEDKRPGHGNVIVSTEDAQARVAQSARRAKCFGMSPDEVAQKVQTARKANMPFPAVNASKEMYLAAQDAADFRASLPDKYKQEGGLAKARPASFEFLIKPENAALVKDSVSTVEHGEGIFRRFARGFASDEAQRQTADFVMENYIYGNPTAETDRQYEQYRQRIAELSDDGMDIWSGAGVGLHQFLGQARTGSMYASAAMLAAGAAVAATGAGAPAGTLMTTAGATGLVAAASGTGMTFGSAYEGFKRETAGSYMDMADLRDENGVAMPSEVTRSAALVAGALKTGIEQAQFATFISKIPGANKIFSAAGANSAAAKSAFDAILKGGKEYSKDLASEIGQENVQQAIDFAVRNMAKAYCNQKYGTKFAIDGGADFSAEMIDNTVGSFYQFALTMLPGNFMQSVGGYYKQSRERAQRITNAKTAAAVQQQLNTAAAGMPLATRSPRKAVELIDDIHAKSGVTHAPVYVPARAIAEHLDSKAMHEEEKQDYCRNLAGSNLEDITFAANTDSRLEMSQAQLAVLCANEPELGAQLVSQMKAEPNGIEITEAGIAEAEQQAQKTDNDTLRYVVSANVAAKTDEDLAKLAQQAGVDKVYVAPDAVKTLFQDGRADEDVILKTLGVSKVSFDEALENGSDIEVKTESLMSDGGALFSSLRDDLKLEEDGMTLREASAFQLEGEQDADWQEGGVWRKRTDTAIADMKSAREVEANAKAQLIMAGLADNVADSTAKVFAAHTLRMANKLKISPETYRQIYANVKFVRGTDAKGNGVIYFEPMNRDVNLDKMIPVVDLTDETSISGEFKIQDIVSYIQSLESKDSEFKNLLKDVTIQIVSKKIRPATAIYKRRIANIAKHLARSSVHLDAGDIKIRNAVLFVIDKVLSNSVLIESVPNYKTDKKADVALYHYLYAPVSVLDNGTKKYYTIQLVTEEDKANLGKNPIHVELYEVKVKRKLGSLVDATSPDTGAGLVQANPTQISVQEMLKDVKDFSGNPYIQTFNQAVKHASPAIFTAFDHSFMGTGEGAQAYGWGTYAAMSQEVIDWYLEKFKDYVHTPDYDFYDAFSDGNITITKDGKPFDFTAFAQKFISDKDLAEDMADEVAYEFMDIVQSFATFKGFSPKFIKKGMLGYFRSKQESAENSDFKNKNERAAFYKELYNLFDSEGNSFSVEDSTIPNVTDWYNSQFSRGAHQYDVEIPDVIKGDNYLDWDNEVSEKQLERIARGLMDTLKDTEHPAYYIESEDDLKRFAESYSRQGKTGRAVYYMLSEHFGSDKAASQFLDSIGIVGNMYLDGISRNNGEGTYNFVIFNEKNAQIVRRLFQEGKETAQKIRGSIGLPQQFGNNAPVQITITPNADFSTAVHELGHFFLWEQFNLAQMLPDDAQLQSDVQTIREWLGMGEEQAELTTEQHEKFARGFEAYLREGKAPSVELMSVFQRFKSWLCEVYKSLTELDVELSDDVRGVFDRMLATEEQTDAVRMGTFENFESFEGFGETEQGEGILNALVGEFAESVARENDYSSRARVLSDILKVYDKRKEAQSGDTGQKIRADIEREVSQMPVYRAMSTMRDYAAARLNKAQLAEQFGADAVSAIPADCVADTGGLAPDTAASMFGYVSGDEFVTALKNAPVMEDEINARFEEHFLDMDAENYARVAAEEAMAGEASCVPLVMERESMQELMSFSAEELAMLEEEAAALEEQDNSPTSRKSLLKWMSDNGKKISLSQAQADFAEDALLLKNDIGGKFFSESGTGLDELAQDLSNAGVPVSSGDELLGLLMTHSIESPQEKKSRGEKIRNIKARIKEINAKLKQQDKAQERAARQQAREAFAIDRIIEQEEYKRKREELKKRAEESARAVTAAAREQISRLPYANVEGKIAIYRSQEQACRHEASEAMKAHDFNRAFNAKDREILFHALTGEARIAAKESKRVFDTVWRVKERRRKDTQFIPQEFMNQVDLLFNQFGFSHKDNPYLSSVQSLDSFCASMEQACIPCPIDRRIRTGELDLRRQGREFIDLTVGELRMFKEALDWLVYNGRESKRLSDEFGRRDLASAAFDLAAYVSSNLRTLTDENNAAVRTTYDETKGEKFKRQLSTCVSSITKIEALCEICDRFKPLGKMQQTIFQPFQNAQDKESKMLRAYSQKFHDLLYGAYSAKDRAKMASKHLVSAVNMQLSKEEVLAVALNMGNEINLERVLTGFGWTQQQLNAVVAELDARDWRFVQGVWDMIDGLWPQIAALQRDICGWLPERVEARAFVADHADRQAGEAGTRMRGGYYPIAYNKLAKENRFIRLATEKQAAEEMFESQFAYAATRHGHTEARARSTGFELELSLGVIDEHLQNVIHDLAYRKAVIDVNKLLRFNTKLEDGSRVAPLQTALVGAFGEQMYNQFQPWLQAVARNEDRTPADLARVVTKYFYRGAQISTLGFKATTWISQLLGWPVAMKKVGMAPLVRNIWRFYKNPFELRRVANAVWDKSEFMRSRNESGGMDRDIRSYLADIKEGTKLAGYKRAMFFMTALFDTGVTIPIWLTGYEQGLKEHNFDETRAIQFADSCVRTTQDIGTVKDLSALQRNNKWITMYYNAGNNVFNMLLKDYYAFKLGDLKYSQALATFLYVVAMPALLYSLMHGGPPKPKDDGDDETAGEKAMRLVKWGAGEVLFEPFDSVPILRDAAQAVQTGYDYKFSPMIDALAKTISSATNIVSQLEGAAFEDEELDARKLYNNVLDFSGYAFHLPAGQIKITTNALLDALTTDKEVRPADYFLYRKR